MQEGNIKVVNIVRILLSELFNGNARTVLRIAESVITGLGDAF